MMETDNPFRDIRLRVTIFMLLQSLGMNNPGKDCKIKSPLRDERSPSFSIFKQGTKWKDHTTGEGGDVIDLYEALHPGVERKEALRVVASVGGMVLKDRDPADLPSAPGRFRREHRPGPLSEEIPQSRLSLYAAELVNKPNFGVPWDLLVTRKGIDPKNLARFAMEASIGKGDAGGLLYLMHRGIKVRNRPETSHNDFWLTGKGSENLFRGEALLNAREQSDCKLRVIVTEGETDAMVLQDEFWNRGMDRSFVVGGLGASWVPDFRVARRYFRGAEVYIIGDNDKAGDTFADRLAIHLRECASVEHVCSYRWALQDWGLRSGETVGDIGEAREKGLMEKLIFSLTRKENWI